MSSCVERDVAALVHPDIMAGIRKEFDKASLRKGDGSMTKEEFVSALMQFMPRSKSDESPARFPHEGGMSNVTYCGMEGSDHSPSDGAPQLIFQQLEAAPHCFWQTV